MPENDLPTLEELTTCPLPAPLAARRHEVLATHREDADELTVRFNRAWRNMLDHEVFVHRLDGMDPQTSAVAARNNLAVKRRDLEEEMLAEMSRLFDALRKRLTTLLEDAQDYRDR